MKIVCPQCGFTREVPDDRLPGTAAVATCPHCRHRFKVMRPAAAAEGSAPAPRASNGSGPAYAPEEGRQSAAEPGPENARQRSSAFPEEDDPLPPGAVIPGREPDPKPYSVQEDAQNARTQKADGGRASTPGQRGSHDQRDATEEEYRRAALAAYEQAAQTPPDGEYPMENPWEHPEKEGYLAAFYQTSMRVMFAAPRFFAGLRPDTPQHKALIFYLLVGICQILIERLWGDILSSTLAPTAGSDPQLQQLLQMLTPQTNIVMAILLRSAMVTLELFAAAGLFFLIFKLLVPHKANYQLIFQVLAYSSAPALLCIVPVAGSAVGFIWGIACSFVGCRHALGLSWGQTAMGLVPIYAMAIPVLFYVFQSMRAMTG